MGSRAERWAARRPEPLTFRPGKNSEFTVWVNETTGRMEIGGEEAALTREEVHDLIRWAIKNYGRPPKPTKGERRALRKIESE